MEKLKHLLSKLDANSTVNTIRPTFSEIADILLFKSNIQTANGNYRILEIEFYFKNKNHEDNVTIKRYKDEDAGMWWLHEWGVDLSFKCNLSNKNKCDKYYGGILIRSMMSLNNDNQNEKELFFGPRNCSWELFYSSALEQNSAPRIIMTDEKNQLIGKMATTKRYITGKTKKIDGDYRFYVDGLNLTIDPNYKKASPWK